MITCWRRSLSARVELDLEELELVRCSGPVAGGSFKSGCGRVGPRFGRVTRYSETAQIPATRASLILGS